MKWGVVLGVLLLSPLYALAAGTSFFGPLVPACTEYGGAVPICQACNLVQLADNLIRFFISLAVMIASLMFAYAGFLYVSASSNKQNIDSARKIFTNVFIGLILVLAAFLIVDMILRVLTNSSLNVLSQIQCVKMETTTGSIKYTVVPGQNNVSGSQGGGTGTKNEGKGLDNVDSNTNYNPIQCAAGFSYSMCGDPVLKKQYANECMQGCEYSSNGKPIITVQDYKNCKAGVSSNPHLSCSEVLARGVTVAAPQDAGIEKGAKFTWPELADRYGLPRDTVFTADDRYSPAGCGSPAGCTYGHPQGRSSYSVDVARCGTWNKNCSLPSFSSGTPMKTKPTPVPGG